MEEKSSRILADIFNGILTALICVVAFLLIVFTCFNFVYVQTPVYGVSMQPLLNPTATSAADSEEFAFVNKYGPIARNNVVVADVPWFTSGSIIKRVVGIHGDLINVEDEGENYALYVNDKLFYTRAKTALSTSGTYTNLTTFGTRFPENVYTNESTGKQYIRVREGEYFLLGDNWEASTDSAVHGCTKQAEIVGRVDFIIHKSGSYVWQYLTSLVKITFTTQPSIFA